MCCITSYRICLSVSLFVLLPILSLGQHIDSIIIRLDSKLPSPWRVHVTERELKLFTDDSLKHYEFTFNRFDIMDTSSLINTLSKIDSLRNYLITNPHCYNDPGLMKFVQYKTMQTTKRIVRKSEKKFKKRERECREYDLVMSEFLQLLIKTPIFFSDSLALGIPSLNDNKSVHRYNYLTGQFDPNEGELNKIWKMIKLYLKNIP